ncbi:MAG: hypothetical protein H0U01_04215 [Acidimicrobiia bacterium]|nr:hypothetical protein [Acidimicrobiia bacterium]
MLQRPRLDLEAFRLGITLETGRPACSYLRCAPLCLGLDGARRRSWPARAALAVRAASRPPARARPGCAATRRCRASATGTIAATPIVTPISTPVVTAIATVVVVAA